MSTPTIAQLTPEQLAALLARIETVNAAQLGRDGEKPTLLRPNSDWAALKLLVPTPDPQTMKDIWYRLSVWTRSPVDTGHRLEDFAGTTLTVLFGSGRLRGLDSDDDQPFAVALEPGRQIVVGQIRDARLDVPNGLCILLTEAEDGGPGGEPQTKDN